MSSICMKTSQQQAWEGVRLTDLVFDLLGYVIKQTAVSWHFSFYILNRERKMKICKYGDDGELDISHVFCLVQPTVKFNHEFH